MVIGMVSLVGMDVGRCVSVELRHSVHCEDVAAVYDGIEIH